MCMKEKVKKIPCRTKQGKQNYKFLLFSKEERKQLVLYGTFPIHILEDPELWPPGSQSPQIGQI
jgi:hypothetical protein